MSNKETAIIVQGHMYLFWANGIYYIREMAEKYNIVLVVPEEYKSDEQFSSFCEELSILEVFYFTESEYFAKYKKNRHFRFKNLTRHFDYSNLAQQVLEKYNPRLLMQHDYIGIENMYFFHWASALIPMCKKIVILSSQPSNEKTLAGVAEFKRFNAQRTQDKIGLPAPISLAAQYIFRYTQSLFRNVLMPMLILKAIPYYPLSAVNNIDIIPRRNLFDYFLLYENLEKKFYENLFQSSCKVQIIENAIKDNYNLNDMLYDVVVSKKIAIFFSLTGLKGTNIDEDALTRWSNTFTRLNAKFPKYEIVLKFHPSFSSALRTAMKAFIHKRCPYMQFIEDQTSAAELILQSKIVIGDASSTLIWANYLSTKVVVSFNQTNMINSGDMNRYEGIYCIEDDSKVADIAFEALENMNGAYKHANKGNKLSLFDFATSITTN